MRKFNDFEKSLILFIVTNWADGGQLKVGDLLSEVASFSDVMMKCDFYEQKITVFTDKEVQVEFMLDGFIYRSEHINLLRSRVLSLLSLLDYLEKHHLVYVFKEWNMPKSKFTSILNSDYIKEEHPVQCFGKQLEENILDKFYYSVVSTPELKELVNNGYVDVEEKRHDDNIGIQKVSVGVALAFGAGGILLSVIAIVVSIIAILLS